MTKTGWLTFWTILYACERWVWQSKLLRQSETGDKLCNNLLPVAYTVANMPIITHDIA